MNMQYMWSLMLVMFGALKTSQGATLTLLDETFDGSTQFQISSEFFSDTANDFFGILNADGITGLFSGGPGDVSSALPGTEPFMVSSSFQVSGFDNAYLVAQDLDGDGGPKEVTVTWENLDISGCAPDSLRLAGKFATDDALNGEFDFDAADFVRILASLDAGSDTLVLEWSINGSGASFNKQPRLTDDTNTSLTSTALEVQRSIPGSGTSMTLKLAISLDSEDEDIAVSNLVVTCDAASTSTTSSTTASPTTTTPATEPPPCAPKKRCEFWCHYLVFRGPRGKAKLWSMIPDCQLCRLSSNKYQQRTYAARQRSRTRRSYERGLLQASEVQSPGNAWHEVDTDSVHFFQVTRGHHEL